MFSSQGSLITHYSFSFRSQTCFCLERPLISALREREDSHLSELHHSFVDSSFTSHQGMWDSIINANTHNDKCLKITSKVSLSPGCWWEICPTNVSPDFVMCVRTFESYHKCIIWIRVMLLSHVSFLCHLKLYPFSFFHSCLRHLPSKSSLRTLLLSFY